MTWEIEYFQDDGSVPGEQFEEMLERSHSREERGLLNSLRRWVQYAAEEGPLGEGGGRFEKCRDTDVWQIKASRGNRRGRWFFGWDGEKDRLVLLSGIVKGPREATPPAAYAEAQRHWVRYMETRRVAKEES